MFFEERVTPNGWLFETERFVCLFGNRESSLAVLQQTYPHFTFRRVKQVHGDNIVENQPNSADWSVEADGHFTTEVNTALCSISADCVPLFFIHRTRPWIMALHAGWRGVAKRISHRGLEIAQQSGLSPGDFDVFIGPHILENSFEVRQDALELLRLSTQLPSSQFVRKTSEDRFLVCLLSILQAQLAEHGVQPDQIHIRKIDTYTNSQLHSFRRDGAQSGRQISFIALKG